VVLLAGAANRDEQVFPQPDRYDIGRDTVLATRMPWCRMLDDTERRFFLGLLRRMLGAPRAGAGGVPEKGVPGLDATARSE